mgnify:CR=1 FL=1
MTKRSMTDIDTLKEELIARARLIQQELGLAEWRLGVRFVQPTELSDPTAAAETVTTARYLRGEILISEFALPRYTLDEWQETLWHEHLHVAQTAVEGLLDDWAHGPYISDAQLQERRTAIREVVEPFVERLARFLAARLKVVDKKEAGFLSKILPRKEKE